MSRIFLIVGLFYFFYSLNYCPCYSYTFSVYEPPEIVNGEYTSYPKITKLESIILKRTYENEDIENRLRRLEEKTCSRVYSGSDLAWRVDNITNKIDQSELYNIPSKDLAAIEKRIFGKSYKKDNLESRLSRLEYQMLGAMQSGNPDERFQTILNALNHYTNFSRDLNNPLTAISANSIMPSGGIKNTFRNIFNTIAGSGSITGYTPPISPYGFNTPYGFNPSYGTYGPRGFFNNHNCPHLHSPNIGFNTPSYNYQIPQLSTQYYNFNNNYDSGLGIHILD